MSIYICIHTHTCVYLYTHICVLTYIHVAQRHQETFCRNQSLHAICFSAWMCQQFFRLRKSRRDYCRRCVFFSVVFGRLQKKNTTRPQHPQERWGAGVETQKNVRGEIGGWGRVSFNEPYAPSLSTIYDGA